MRTRHATSPEQVLGFDTAALRANYLVEDLFPADRVETVYSHHDRLVIGGVAPEAPVGLGAPPAFKADFFLQRREAGVVNIDTGPGVVTVDGTEFEVVPKAVLFVWAMGGENTDYSDVIPAPIETLR